MDSGGDLKQLPDSARLLPVKTFNYGVTADLTLRNHRMRHHSHRGCVPTHRPHLPESRIPLSATFLLYEKRESNSCFA